MLLSLLLALTLPFAHAATSDNEAIWDTRNQTWLDFPQMVAAIKAGEVVILGENHATPKNASLPETIVHHENQLRLLTALRAAGQDVSVGMEFLTYTQQPLVDQYRAGTLSEADFLAAAWAGNDFASYRQQILFAGGGRTVALNIPAEIPSHVSQLGPADLTPAERLLLPPIWDRGNEKYYQRFREAMVHHVPEEKIENYFWAQSLWDATMAWKVVEHQTYHAADVLVVIVGAFHAEYGGGLPAVLKSQLATPVTSIVQVEVPDWASDDVDVLKAPDPVYGEHADFIWMHSKSR